jgi:hypothetical protein
MIRGVPGWEVELVWGQVRPLIEKALSRNNTGEYEPIDFLKGCVSGDMQLWIGGDFEAVGVTTITKFPRKIVCQILLGGGSGLHHFKEGKDVIAEWAKAQGCDEIRGGGRKGWLRVFGWPQLYVICGKEL